MGIKHYDKAFKERAVKLSYERSSVLQAARELGISVSSVSGAKTFHNMVLTPFRAEACSV